MAYPRLELSRSQILGFRRRVGALDERLRDGASSLRRAAWAGLQDSMPRAALLSLHARIRGVGPAAWEHSSLVQIWGPRFNNYVVAAKDLSVFTLGRLPRDPRGRARAQETASGLHAVLDGRRLPFGQAGKEMGVVPNRLRYAAATGSVLIRWDGARQPVVWTVHPPSIDSSQAQLELARRYLHVFGPATANSFAHWAGISPSDAHATWAALHAERIPVRTPIGDASILAADEAEFRIEHDSAAPARLLPSGDAYYLFWGVERELLVPEPQRRAALWTDRVWPGALLVDGEIAGVWRRAGAMLSVEVWRRLSPSEREAVEKEAASLPLPDVAGSITLRWNDRR